MWTPKVITLWEALLTVLQFGLLLIHAYAQDKHWPFLSIPLERSERPEDWVPESDKLFNHGGNECGDCFEIMPASDEKDDSIVDIFSVHSYNGTGPLYQNVPENDMAESSTSPSIERKIVEEDLDVFSVWRQQFLDAITLESPGSKKRDSNCLQMAGIFWQLCLAPWRLLFAFVPPYQIAHGWISFISSLIFISGIAYMVTQLTDQISCVTGINPYVIAFTALAGGTSWPDLVASKIAAERQVTADSAIANITCSNSVNIFIGIGIPWLIDTAYNFFVYQEPLYIQNAGGLSFSLLVFFATSACCIAVLVLRRLVFGAELGGPRLWAWLTSVYFMFLWIIFVVLSSLKVSGII